jgi:ketosteroid isomerase-like protein
MTRKGFWVVLSLVFSLVLLSGCQKDADDANRAAATPCPTVEPANTAAIETELLRIENDWPRVIKEHDAEAVKRAEADDGFFVYPDGSVGTKATDVQDMQSGALSADSWELSELRVTVLSADAATVSGRSIVKNGKYKTPDGKSTDISGQYRFIDTFARRNGEWKLVAGASVPVRSPGPSASPVLTPTPSTAASPTTRPSPAASASPATRPSPRIVPPRVTVSPVMRPTP